MNGHILDLDTFSYDENLGEYYSEHHNCYMSVDEYKQLEYDVTHTQCDRCGGDLMIDEICWCN